MEDSHPSFLKILAGVVNFSWYFFPAKGTTGGILVGLRDEPFIASNASMLIFFVRCMSQDRKKL
jgi:hypothetical protein